MSAGCGTDRVAAPLRTVANAMTPPAAHTTAHTVMAAANESVSDGRAATAKSPAMRATALLTPDPTPRCRSSTAAKTVAVSGATVSVMPRPNSTTAGNTADT